MQTLISGIIKYWVSITVCASIVIILFSLYPEAQLKDFSSNDKLRHVTAYCLLFFPIAVSQPRNWILIGFCIIAVSGVIEMVQPMVNRHAEWHDVVANFLGVFWGAMAGVYTRALYTRLLSKNDAKNSKAE